MERLKLTRFIGDVHGWFRRYEKLLDKTPHPSIQVGDLGVGFKDAHGEIRRDPPYDKMMKGGHRAIRGNHDNPSVFLAEEYAIQDGTIENGVMFIGGATSVDQRFRREGYDWWSDEELSHDQLDDVYERYRCANPKVMITHECPEYVADKYLKASRPQANEYGSRMRGVFEEMMAWSQPKLWIFGHWHTPLDVVLDGTRFICLPELEYIDINLEEYTT